MSSISDDFKRFSQFVELYLHAKEGAETLDDLYAEWRACNPTPDQLEKDVLAVKASLRDMDNGIIGRPIEEFEREFCQRNGL